MILHLKYRIFARFALLCSCSSAVPTRAAEVDPKFKPGEELLDAWRTDQAEALAAKSVKENPKSAAALEFDGRVKFYQGRYTEALASFDRALAIDSKDERRQALKLLTQLTVDVQKSLKRYESAHFILFADDKRDGILAALRSTRWKKATRTSAPSWASIRKKKCVSKSPRTQPASTPSRLYRCVTSKRPGPSESASSTS